MNTKIPDVYRSEISAKVAICIGHDDNATAVWLDPDDAEELAHRLVYEARRLREKAE